MLAARPRKLHRGHFAFMRGILQGLEPIACRTHYLSKGAGTDAHVVRGESAAAAEREAKPGTARLVLIDIEQIGPADDRPTLEAFALERGMEDFSQAEQVEAYTEAFGPTPRRTALQLCDLAAVVPVATALVPLETFLVQVELSGQAGRYRALLEQCLLGADNDYTAIAVWLAAKRPGKAAGVLSATQRAYRKEAERFLLWAKI